MSLHSVSFKYPIWRIHTNGELGKVIVETRDKVQKIMVLYLVSLDDFHIKEIDLRSESIDWWTQVVGVSKSHLILGLNSNPELPVFTSHQIYDIDTGIMILEKWNHSLLQYSDLGTKWKDTNGSLKYIDYHGLEIASFETQDQNPKVILGDFCTVDDGLYQDFIQMFQDKNLMSPMTSIQYAESGKFLILAYGFAEEDKLQYCILVIDDQGEIHLYHKIFRDNKGLIGASFFIFGNSVLFLADVFGLEIYGLE